MKISFYDASIWSVCIFSLCISAICVLTLLDSGDHCDGSFIALTLVLQGLLLTVFAVLPYVIARLAKKGLQPSSARRKLIYATLGGLAFEFARSAYMLFFLGHTASCI
jgi:hypothetical protein